MPHRAGPTGIPPRGLRLPDGGIPAGSYPYSVRKSGCPAALPASQQGIAQTNNTPRRRGMQPAAYFTNPQTTLVQYALERKENKDC